MSGGEYVQLVISQLKQDAPREEFLRLHKETQAWMQAHPECVAYEVFEGDNGSNADRITWRSKEGARIGNRDYSEHSLAK